ncbi:hypothetical protein E2C01_029363 [Portunus trituberculatus]|uniref:Uncharacterized protein n=1 Tax=Portunus trituberculatus TaxID=210409 RepID=A0A5B7EUE7_PORTR|nr:hypothetical protein [Portunus trituberculatus]
MNKERSSKSITCVSNVDKCRMYLLLLTSKQHKPASCSHNLATSHLPVTVPPHTHSAAAH